MREDMFKVIVERPRRLVHKAPRVKSRHDRLPERTKLGMKRGAQEQCNWTKYLNENLAPLKRYLQKQRGRLWDKVYSEICARLDTRSAVKQHVRDHLEDLIVFRVVVGKDGALLASDNWSLTLHPLHESRRELYVDPKDGIIKEVAKLRRKLGLPVSRRARWGLSPPQREDVVVLSEWEELRRIGGIWLRVRFAQNPTAPKWIRCFDLLERQEVWVGQRHAVEKRQLSKAELARHGLCNLV